MEKNLSGGTALYFSFKNRNLERWFSKWMDDVTSAISSLFSILWHINI
jgi:hypothetical protein